ncbi:ABC transporter substrate-binding protein [Marinactinospora thermotolerans]|uniref:Multiple sugar transport system substrate-binding protein n=1 Tax=Marinactinospora thermotolerans DSM 45154 TaxID=1122192 RepID=A0A1T4RRC1_9ACTN|nr:ABC transporter substrate-binding protein [Marinactinospora thermotolerans]SKA18493.1 multiple sugar transport system substrate-binding protein [Marinactinospora thermotolerans DSM 45154]
MRRPGPGPFSRAIALAVCLVLGSTACSGSLPGDQDEAVVTFAATRASGGDLGALVERYNQENPDAPVRYVPLSAEADEQRTAMVQDLQARTGLYDVLYLDAVWTAEFAARGWLEPLEEERFAGPGILAAATETGRWNGRLYAAPFATGTGLLFYRTDLLDSPPRTWAELIDACAIAERNDMDCYAGQYMRYEGITVALVEAVASAGGEVITPQGEVVVDSPEGREGLGFLVEAMADGHIPQAALTYNEDMTRLAFQRGDLLFMRNWAFAYPLMNSPGEESVVQGRFDAAPLPGPDGPGTGTLGGNNLALSVHSDHKDEALRFIEFMQSEEVMRDWLADTSTPMARDALFEDPALLEEAPYLAAVREGMDNVSPRPVTARYNDVTNAIQKSAYAAMTGEMTVDEAVTTMQEELERAVRGT